MAIDYDRLMNELALPLQLAAVPCSRFRMHHAFTIGSHLYRKWRSKNFPVHTENVDIGEVDARCTRKSNTYREREEIRHLELNISN